MKKNVHVCLGMKYSIMNTSIHLIATILPQDNVVWTYLRR